jgi:hypothetical protein
MKVAMKTINLGFATITIETHRTFVSDFIDSTFRPGDAKRAAILSTLTVVGGGLLAWFM